MIWTRLGLGLAFSRDARQTWRQISVLCCSALAAALLFVGIAAIAFSVEAQDKEDVRSPRWAASEAHPALKASLRAFSIDAHQVTVVWLEPGPGHEGDPAIIPPGLKALPEPGAAVVSPAVLARGYSPEKLGWKPSHAGLGEYGTIGEAGLATSADLWVYARPQKGRTLGAGGALLTLDGYGGEETGVPLGAESGIPDTRATLSIVVLFGFIPAIVLLISGGTALSVAKQSRITALERIGMTRRQLLAVSSAEVGGLTSVGAATGALVPLVYLLTGNALPVVGMLMYPGRVALLTAVWVASVGAAVIMAIVASGVRRQSKERALRAGLWMAPFVTGLLALGASLGLSSGSEAARMLVVVGVVLAVVGLPLCVPGLTRWVGSRLARSDDALVWLSGRRLLRHPVVAGRPAVMVALVLALGGVAMSMSGTSAAVPLSASGPALSIVDWRDARPGDLAVLRSALADARLVAADDTNIRAASCAEAAGLFAMDLSRACEAGKPTSALRAIASEAGYGLTIGKLADVQDAAVMATGMSDAQIYRAVAGRLPAFNLSTPHNSGAFNAIQPWTILLGAAGGLAIIVTFLRELGDRILELRLTDRMTSRAGIIATEGAQVERTAVFAAVLASAPLGLSVAVLHSFSGRHARLGLGRPLTSLLGFELLLTVAAVGATAAIMALLRPGSRLAAAAQVDRDGGTSSSRR